ncbi:MAG: hypothetical protein ABIT05_02750 [Chitinophagaceae bacterium]
MIRFLTSLSFLYGSSIAILLIYGFLFYRSFIKNGHQRRQFPLVFFLVSLGCFSFLYFNIHAPLSLKTFSNLDHHFIRHEGFRVAGGIELGRTDTVNYKTNSFSQFLLEKENSQLKVSSSYSEEPFYAGSGGSYKLISPCYGATGHSLSFRIGNNDLRIKATGDNSFELSINNNLLARVQKTIKKGATAWNIFKDDIGFISSPGYTDEKLQWALKQIVLLRDDVSREKAGDLRFFLSGKVFRYTSFVKYDGKEILPGELRFAASLPDQSSIAWGFAFLDNNKNQFRVNYLGADSFTLINRYPVAYPLAEENRDDWTPHEVSKFLVSDQKDMLAMPPVFSEGFLFPALNADSSIDFSPVLLSYRKDRSNASLQFSARFIDGRVVLTGTDDKLLLPAKSSGFSWVFSIQNSFDWNFGNWSLAANEWQLLLFGSLIFFFLLVITSSWLTPASKLSWIWQLLSCVTIVLLTTRFFLYWRYKSFPPYEGLDLPSQQQLYSFWNFGIILVVTILLAMIFGAGSLKWLYNWVRKHFTILLKRSYREPAGKDLMKEERITHIIRKIPFLGKRSAKTIFFTLWVAVLSAGAGFALLNNFDPTVCRHLAIALILAYFLFLYISYQFSPLVASSEKSWWSISTGRSFDIIINNPVKVLLSVSLLALFTFVDIGFAIVFLNFLLFNEAFLCINYAIAGLSAGSKKNASLFGFLGFLYLGVFSANLVYGPYIFNYLLDLPQWLYVAGYIFFAIIISYTVIRLLFRLQRRKKTGLGLASAVCLFMVAFLFFPKERILEKAAITKYRIDVMTMPVDKAIETAYEEGKTYEPVIRAAQNQWFINTFIYEKNNPSVNNVGFNLLPHAPQNKGAKYNAQATDLVTSRFFIAEHGKWSVLLYVLLLLLPTTLLASFYKLYPDFTNRINASYPTITAGFSLLNYLLITALLVILAATGRYIFFGQDLPFGSILSKQSILFPSVLIVVVVFLFKRIPLEQYPNPRKVIPGSIVFAGLGLLLFLVQPVYNKNKEFGVADLAEDMDAYIESRLQPIFDYIDSSKTSRRFSMFKKDQIFTDSVRKLLAGGFINDAGKFFTKEIESYTRAGFSRHLDQGQLLYLDLYSGRPQLAVNDNFFRVEPPPHLQQSWTGNVFSDTTTYNVTLWNTAGNTLTQKRVSSYNNEKAVVLDKELQLIFRRSYGENFYGELCLVNHSASSLHLYLDDKELDLVKDDTLLLRNPSRLRITNQAGSNKLLVIQPDAFMKNFYVNGNRFYVYPMGANFIWAKNFSESISSAYTASGETKRDAFISLDAVLTDSLSAKMKFLMNSDTAYKKGAEYGICIADGNGRLITMSDFIKDLHRPDPNDKPGFNKMIRGENGFISQSLLRKQIGNINLLRMNPGPGSTLKPIIFTAIASQLNMNWDAFAAEGFSQKQQFFGGEKVAEYDFEKNNGRISSVADYLKYSDNYYHSNLLLLGSYSRQSLQALLTNYFQTQNPEGGFHWPYFNYAGKQYWLNGFENWPGYINGKADFGSDSSFVSVGLFHNYSISTYKSGRSFDKFSSGYDSLLFRDAYKTSGFILPEYALFDQKGAGMNHARPNELFMSSFRGHVKGSSQVMVPPVKMLDAFGKMASQNRNYSLTLNPYAKENPFNAFYVDNGVSYSNYLGIIREKVFEGMKQALFSGTAARLGKMLTDGSPYYYYAKTGTTGDDESSNKSKLFVIIISKKDITKPGFNFRNNKFYTIYFTSQNGPPKQQEEFQAAVIKCVQESAIFKRYMNEKNQ